MSHKAGDTMYERERDRLQRTLELNIVTDRRMKSNWTDNEPLSLFFSLSLAVFLSFQFTRAF